MEMNTTKTITTHIEDIFGEFGFRLRWKITDDYWADVEVFELIASREGNPCFQKKDGNGADFTESLDEAEQYLEGFVKWDGCSEFTHSHVHWCGPEGYNKHFKLLKHIYEKAMELMGRDEPWKDS